MKVLKMGRRIFLWILGLFLCVNLSASENNSFMQESYIRYIPSEKTKSEDAKIEIIQTYTQFSYETKIKDKLPVKFSLEHDYIGIGKDNLRKLDLPTKLVGLGFDLESTLPTFFKNIYLRLGLKPSSYRDTYEFCNSSFRIPLRAYFVHLLNERLFLIYGLAVYPDFEDEIFPILGLIYKPDKRLKFELVPKRPNITYDLTDNLSLFLEGGLTNYEFEVNRETKENVVLAYKDIHIAGGLKFRIKKLDNFLSIGETFARRFKYLDNQGKIKLKNSYYIEYRIKLDF